MLKYVEGNLIEMFKNGEFNMIAHQCNCFGLGAGIAGQLVKEWPEVGDFPIESPFRLYGTHQLILLREGVIANLFSQYEPGPCSDGPDGFMKRLQMLEKSLAEAILDYKETSITPLKLGIPLLASGIAADRGLKGQMSDLEYFKEYIAPTVERITYTVDTTVVIYKR